MQNKIIQVPGPLYSSYDIQTQPLAREVILLLHGYAESADYFYAKIKQTLPPAATVISANGPFFVPVKTEAGYRAGYSWYFYNGATDEYITGMSIAENYLSNILKAEKLENLPLTIIGYSQGGYLAPFAGLKLPQTKRVIGINCQFLDEEFPSLPKFELVAINGSNDDVVDYKNAHASVEKLKFQGVDVTEILVPGATHRVGTEILNQLEKVLKISHG